MIFDNCQRSISKITDQELRDLVNNNREENQWIEFKREYPNSSRKKFQREICKDVTAMANADGGYIFIGVDEKLPGPPSGFFSVDEAKKLAQSINDICLDSIERRIRGMEVEPRCLKWDESKITLVIVHIPPSNSKPQGIIWDNSIQFVRRYGSHTKQYRISDLGDDFSARQLPPGIRELHDKLDAISSNALGQPDLVKLADSIEQRFQEAIGRLS